MKMKMKNIIDLNYPLNFIKYAYGDDHPFDFTAEDINIDEFGAEIDELLMKRHFNSRDINVLHMRFKDHMTYKAIASEIGKTSSRVSQIINTLAIIMRRSTTYNYLSMKLNKDKYVRLTSRLLYDNLICNVYDISEVVMIVEYLMSDKGLRKYDEDKDFDIDIAYNRLRGLGGSIYLSMIQYGILQYIDNRISMVMFEFEFDTLIDGSLRDLNITDTTYRTICRNGYKTIRELVNGMNAHTSPDEFISGLRNVDTESYIELINALIEKGIPIPKEHRLSVLTNDGGNIK